MFYLGVTQKGRAIRYKSSLLLSESLRAFHFYPSREIIRAFKNELQNQQHLNNLHV